VLEPASLGIGLMAYVLITMKSHGPEAAEAFRTRILAIDEVLECQKLTGEADLILIEGVMGLFDGKPSAADLARHFGVPVLGVIDMHVTGQRWVGAAGHPTRLVHQGRSTDCHTRKSQSLDRAILSASNPDFFSTDERPALDALREATAWRVWGASCMAYGLVASGRIDLSLDTALAVHDWAPFAPIIEGAGGKVTDWQGRPLRLDSGPQVLAAGDPLLHDRALGLIRA
jgi:fructose-1,6-bisphosphatase/inositol monophosphatase family enzyme